MNHIQLPFQFALQVLLRSKAILEVSCFFINIYRGYIDVLHNQVKVNSWEEIGCVSVYWISVLGLKGIVHPKIKNC